MIDYDCMASPLAREAADLETPPQRLELLARERTVQRLVAANPATPPDTLKRLRRVANRATRAAVASNPNSPIEVLLELVPEFPLEVLDNPVLPLLTLANPELPGQMARQMTPEAQCALLRCEQVPRAILKPLATSPDESVRALAALHVSLAGEPGPGELVQAEAAFHAALSQVVVGEPQVVFELPGLLSPWFLALLLDTPCAELIPRCPDAPAEVLLRLARSGSPLVLVGIAAHPNTPARLLAQLALHTVPEVRLAVACNPAISTRLLSDLANTSHVQVRLAVARHPAAGAATLAELARDWSPRIRAAVARNPGAPQPLVRQLAADMELEVRAAAQRHLPLRPALLTYYSKDPNPIRRRAVAAHPDTAIYTLDYLHRDRDAGVRVAVARHPRTSAALLAVLAKDGDPAVREAVAEHSRLSPEVRSTLERDRDHTVRAHLAHNPHAPYITLKRLWTHACVTSGCDDQIRAIARHPVLTAARRGQFYGHLFAGHLRRLRESPSLVRLAAFASQGLPAEIYEAGGASRHWL
ncbi:MAG TPA: hypothetical protein VF916_03980, partial [Ktedonobacterales bacterium]